MIGRGRVISLTPSGSPRCGTGVERFTSPSTLPKSSANRDPISSPQRKRAPTSVRTRRPEQAVFRRESEVRLIPFPHDALAYAERGNAPDCAARGQLGPAERNPAAGENGDVGPTHRCGSDPSAWRSTDTRSMQARAHDGSSGRGSSGACGSSDTARSRTRQDSRSSHTRRTS